MMHQNSVDTIIYIFQVNLRNKNAYLVKVACKRQFGLLILLGFFLHSCFLLLFFLSFFLAVCPLSVGAKVSSIIV